MSDQSKINKTAALMQSFSTTVERLYKLLVLPLRVGWVLAQAAILRVLIKAACHRTRQKRESDTTHILTFCMGGIGDCIMATPVFEGLKSAYPNSRIHVIGPFYARELFEKNIAGVDHFIKFPDVGCRMRLPELMRFMRVLLRTPFDLYVSIVDFTYAPRMPHNLYAAFIGYVTGIEKRYGIIRQPMHALWPAERWVFRKLLNCCRLLMTFRLSEQDRHIVEDRLEILDMLGIQPGVRERTLVEDPACRPVVEQLILSARIAGRPIVIFGYSSTNMRKAWSPVKFAELGQRLHHELNAFVLLAGSADDSAGQLISMLMAGNCLDLSGKHHLGDFSYYVSLIKAGDLCVAMDSALSHVAIGVGTPVIMIFGPSLMKVAGPLDDRYHRAIAPADRELCRHCHPKNCAHPPTCINTISVDDVFQGAVELLGRKYLLAGNRA
jgi:heptosyltransferase-2